MKKEILAAAAVSGSLLMISGAWAQTCVTPPSCEELGYTKSASDCEGMESLLCPFDKSKYYCVDVAGSPANAAPGMILYSDGTVSENVVSGKTPVGVVAYVAGSTRLAVALEEVQNLRWCSPSSTDCSDISCLANYLDPRESGGSPEYDEAISDFSGPENTQCIIHTTGDFPAAEYCNSYKPVSKGIGSSGWYLPAVGEWNGMLFYIDNINQSLQKLSRTVLGEENEYWTSSEGFPATKAWVALGSTKYTNWVSLSGKSFPYIVRCFITF